LQKEFRCDLTIQSPVDNPISVSSAAVLKNDEEMRLYALHVTKMLYVLSKNVSGRVLQLSQFIGRLH